MATLTLEDEAVARAIADRLDAFLAQESIMAVRRTKSGMKETDIRPLIHTLTVEGRAIHAVMTLTERLACKPGMLLEALTAFCGFAEAPRAMVVRNRLLGLTEEGNLAPLETL